MIRIPGRTNFRNKFQIQQDLVLIDLSFIPQYITYVGIKSEAEQQTRACLEKFKNSEKQMEVMANH